MSWSKISDDFFRNQKIVKAGRDARDLYLVGLCHCCEYMTDGFIGEEYIRLLSANAEIDNAPVTVLRLTSQLVEGKSALWHKVDGGYQVHDFLEYNISRAKHVADRASLASRQRDWRERHKDDDAPVTQPVTQPVTPSVTPLLTPSKTEEPESGVLNPESGVPISESMSHFCESAKPDVTVCFSQDFIDHWKSYPAIGRVRGGKTEAYRAWRKLNAEKRGLIKAALCNALKSADWRDKYAPAVHRWIGGKWEPFSDAERGLVAPTEPPSRVFVIPPNHGVPIKHEAKSA